MATHHPASPCLLLDILPWEIRMHIWGFVCRSPSGSVMLRPSYDRRCLLVDDARQCVHSRKSRWNGHPAWNSPWDRDLACKQCWSMNFAIFRTCKQIYHETKGLLWQRDTLVMEPGLTSDRLFASSGFKQVAHLEIEFAVMNRTAISFFDVIVPYLESLLEASSKTGNLRTFNVRLIHIHNIREPEAWCEDPDQLLYQPDDVIRDVPGLGPVRRKIIIDTTHKTRETKNILYESSVDARKSFTTVMEGLHICFGGQLWRDGRLCYEDERVISPFFDQDPEMSNEIGT